jgi:hypothetical protein
MPSSQVGRERLFEELLGVLAVAGFVASEQRPGVVALLCGPAECVVGGGGLIHEYYRAAA